MSFQEKFNKEKEELTKVKRPYETVAFVVFAVLFFQQVFFLLKNLIDFMDKTNTWFSTANITVVANNQGFFNRIVSIDSSKWLWVILGIVALYLYYFLIYKIVWDYCSKNRLAKWTWTLFVCFGPNILFMPPYVFFAVYAFRKYVFRFFKKVISEFQEFDPNQDFPEDIEELEVEVEKETTPEEKQPVEQT